MKLMREKAVLDRISESHIESNKRFEHRAKIIENCYSANMNETVYIETSILGYLTARSTQNLILAANIEVTKEWWRSRRDDFTLHISQTVLDEIAQGDTEIAAQRLEIVRGFPLLDLNQAVKDLAK